MTTDYRDFDQHWDDQGHEPLRFKALGEEWALPAKLPAPVALRLVRLDLDVKAGRRKSSDKMTPDEIEDLARELLGSETVDILFKKGLDVDQFGEIIEWALERYQERGEIEGLDQNRPAENGSSRPTPIRGRVSPEE